MDDIFSRWVRDVRADARARTEIRRAALTQDIGGLRERAAPRNTEADIPALVAQRDALAQTREELAGRVAAEVERRAAAAREEAAGDLAACEAHIEAAALALDAQLLRDTAGLLTRAGLPADILDRSAAELGRQLDRHGLLEQARAHMAADLARASDLVRASAPALAEVEDLRARVRSLEEAERAGLRRLAEDHDVARPVLDAVVQLDVLDAAALVNDLLAPGVEQAALEASWELDPDVLAGLS